MYPHSFLWHYLWLAPHVLQIPIAVVMYRRGWFRQFPVFFAYTLFQPVEEGTLFFLDHSAAVSPVHYWYAHWMGLAIDVTLRFAIIREIASGVFEKYPGIRRLGRLVFRAAAAVLLLTAVAVVARAPEGHPLHLLSRVHLLDLGVSVVQCGLLLVLVGFSSYFHLSWRSLAYGIGLGLGIFASVDLATETMRVWTGYVAGYAFDFVTMATYHCCVLIWLAYVLAPETVHRTVKELPEHNLEQWNAELQRLLLQ
ncbi:MAG TPA: hypothetical protein VEU11_03705 [Terriglobales bacterium]|nr:hypothetical protein [Terriglobales bacterium]